MRFVDHSCTGRGSRKEQKNPEQLLGVPNEINIYFNPNEMEKQVWKCLVSTTTISTVKMSSKYFNKKR